MESLDISRAGAIRRFPRRPLPEVLRPLYRMSGPGTADLSPDRGRTRTAFIALASTLLESGWREVKSFFEAGAKALPKIEPDERFRFLKIAERLVQGGAAPTSPT